MTIRAVFGRSGCTNFKHNWEAMQRAPEITTRPLLIEGCCRVKKAIAGCEGDEAVESGFVPIDLLEILFYDLNACDAALLQQLLEVRCTGGERLKLAVPGGHGGSLLPGLLVIEDRMNSESAEEGAVEGEEYCDRRQGLPER
jgi:hypothetical protein